MGLGDVLFGRKKLKGPKADKLFALSTAQITLETELGLRPAGVAGVVFKPLSAGEFLRAEQEIDELLGVVAQTSGSEVRRRQDSLGYQWLVVRDRDFEDLVTGVHLVASELAAHGFGEQLLAAIFAFERRDASGRRTHLRLQARRLLAVRPDRQGAGARQRRGAPPRNELQGELPIEEDLTRWLGLFDAPLD